MYLTALATLAPKNRPIPDLKLPPHSPQSVVFTNAIETMYENMREILAPTNPIKSKFQYVWELTLRELSYNFGLQIEYGADNINAEVSIISQWTIKHLKRYILENRNIYRFCHFDKFYQGLYNELTSSDKIRFCACALFLTNYYSNATSLGSLINQSDEHFYWQQKKLAAEEMHKTAA